jgi:hypothetical protein
VLLSGTGPVTFLGHISSSPTDIFVDIKYQTKISILPWTLRDNAECPRVSFEKSEGCRTICLSPRLSCQTECLWDEICTEHKISLNWAFCGHSDRFTVESEEWQSMKPFVRIRAKAGLKKHPSLFHDPGDQKLHGLLPIFVQQKMDVRHLIAAKQTR